MELSAIDPNMIAFVEMLVVPIRVELNPMSSAQDRQEAHRLCEKLRNEEPPSKMATAAIMLLARPEIEIIYAGFRILEDTIRFHWQELNNQVMIKTQLMQILGSGFPSLPNSPVFLLEALARTLVEIAKREWPQLWPDFVPTLFDKGQVSLGPFIVLRRFFEDIILFQRAENSNRKRDLNQGFTAISSETITRLFELIIKSVQESELTKSSDAIRKCKVLLGCLLPFLETANLDNFLQPTRINILFTLLKHPELKTEAADCILLLVQRKPRKEDKYEIVNACLQVEYFQHFIEAVNTADEFDSHLLKQLCDCLSFIAGECTPGKVKEEIFFSACEVLAVRKEAIAVVGCVNAINIFLRNLEKEENEKNFRKSPMAQVVIKIVDLVIRKLVSTPNPDEKEEFTRLKSETFLMLRNVSSVIPNLYIFVNHWIQDAHNANVENYQWEILNNMFDTLTSCLTQEDFDVVRAGLKDLELCFNAFSLEGNLKRKSVLLSSVSALFAFLTLARKIDNFGEHASNMMYSILKSLFQCLRYPESERDIRRHVAALFIKLAIKNSVIFVDIFESIYNEANSMKDVLTVMEYKSIIEALLIVSNEFSDKAKQLNFIGTILPQSDWLEMSVMSNATHLFSADPMLQTKRPMILRNLHILQIIFKRVKFPKESPEFLEAIFNHIRPTLPVVFELVKSVHSLVSIPELAFLVEMSHVEKQHLLGTDSYVHQEETSLSSQEPPKPQDQLKHFVHSLGDLAYTILGSCCVTLSSKIYNIPNLTDAFLNYVGGYSQLMTDYQIRNFVKTVYRNFLLACPTELTNQVVVPFLQQFGPFMMSRLMKRWETVEFESHEQENTSEEKEILENTALRFLTKDYFDIIVRLLERSGSPNEVQTFHDDIDMVDGGGERNGGGASNRHTANEAGEVGLLVLSDPVCFQSIVYLSISALAWKDSYVNLKAVRCIQLSWSKISLQQNVVVETFKMALTGMLILSNQEPNVDLLLKLVDTILMDHQSDPTIVRLFIEWGAQEAEIQKVLNYNKKDVKKRKEALKSIFKNHPLINQNPKSQWLTTLPALNIYKPGTEAKEIDLRECFSPIHNLQS